LRRARDEMANACRIVLPEVRIRMPVAGHKALEVVMKG